MAKSSIRRMSFQQHAQQQTYKYNAGHHQPQSSGGGGADLQLPAAFIVAAADPTTLPAAEALPTQPLNNNTAGKFHPTVCCLKNL